MLSLPGVRGCAPLLPPPHAACGGAKKSLLGDTPLHPQSGKEALLEMATSVPVEVVDQAVEQTRPTIERLARELWQLAELSLLEVKSAQLILDILRAEGFTITSTGTAAVP